MTGKGIKTALWFYLAVALVAPGAELTEGEIRQGAANFVRKPFFPQGAHVARVMPPGETLPYWTVTVAPAGFLILSPDSREVPVVGFSATGELRTDARPENLLQRVLQDRGEQPRIDPRGPRGWQRLLNPKERAPLSLENPSQILTPPLLSTHWTQWAPYNEMCPAVTNAMEGYGGRVPTGCVPVAMAQVLRFYSWPFHGFGTMTNVDTNGLCQGVYTADWTNVVQWENMKDSYEARCTESSALVSPVADLMGRLGVGAKVDYEAGGTSAFGTTLASNVEHSLNYMRGGLVKVTDTNFVHIVHREIATNNRPVIMDLRTAGGHEVVADGLAEDGDVKYVHINYGWAGINDGWYAGYDTGDTNGLFELVLSSLYPNVKSALVSCAPNFFELTVTNNAVSSQLFRVIVCGTNEVSISITSTAPWIILTSVTSASGTRDRLYQVTIDAAQLPFGISDACLDVTGTATNLPRRVGIRIYKPDLPVITQQPENATNSFPESVQLEIVAEPGNSYTPCTLPANLQYQWYYNGARLEKGTNRWCLGIGYGAYYCEVTGISGRVRSEEATIAPPPPKPTIRENPLSQTVAVRGTIRLKVTVEGVGPFIYTWYHNGDEVPGALTDTLTITNASIADSGVYYVMVENEGGYSISSAAQVTVKEIPACQIKIARAANNRIEVRLMNIIRGQISLLTATNLTQWTEYQSITVSNQTEVILYLPVQPADKTRYYRFSE